MFSRPFWLGWSTCPVPEASQVQGGESGDSQGSRQGHSQVRTHPIPLRQKPQPARCPRPARGCCQAPRQSCTFFLNWCLFIFIYLLFWPHCEACRILVPNQGSSPCPPALQLQNLTPWAAREVPCVAHSCKLWPGQCTLKQTHLCPPSWDLGTHF